MGRGDKKTAKGKRTIGSYGITRPRKSSKPAVVVAEKPAEKVAKPKAVKKPAAKKTTKKEEAK
jgi:30S ribosomal protein S31